LQFSSANVEINFNLNSNQFISNQYSEYPQDSVNQDYKYSNTQNTIPFQLVVKTANEEKQNKTIQVQEKLSFQSNKQFDKQNSAEEILE
jgi:hypothetical protein